MSNARTAHTMTPRLYAGIGSRETPMNVLGRFTKVGKFLASFGLTLRSGGAGGADNAFEHGCNQAFGQKEIYLPYEGFRGNTSKLFDVTKEARILSGKFHPCWDNVSHTGRLFMGRNAYQILGLDLKTPVDFVICWTPNGHVKGGTGQALRMADHYMIPVINLGSMSIPEADSALYKILELE